jgi:hypothetical protein
MFHTLPGCSSFSFCQFFFLFFLLIFFVCILLACLSNSFSGFLHFLYFFFLPLFLSFIFFLFQTFWLDTFVFLKWQKSWTTNTGQAGFTCICLTWAELQNFNFATLSNVIANKIHKNLNLDNYWINMSKANGILTLLFLRAELLDWVWVL